MNFFLGEDYQINPEPAYEDDIQDGGIIYQPDVYEDARKRIQVYQARSLFVDVGCGRAGKLLALKGVETVGIDYKNNVKWLRESFPTRTWLDIDLELIKSDALSKSILLGSTVICADVVEHLRDPSNLLRCLSEWMSVVREVVFTTPERELHYGYNHRGPPRNTHHVREWNTKEFESLLKSFGFRPQMFLTRTSTDCWLKHHTIEVLCTRE